MELALNLSWLIVTGLLFAGVFVAYRRGRLQMSLRLALGCTAILALLLFPVISMTDDLQQAKILAEWPATHRSVSGDTAPGNVADTIVLVFLLLLAIASALLVLLALLVETRKRLNNLGRQEPYAVRPPPFVSDMLAA